MSFTDTYRSAPVLSASEVDVPVELQSSQLRRPVPSAVRTVAVSASTGSQNAGGMSQVQIASGMATGAIKPGSVYLRFDATITNGTSTSWNWAQPTRGASSAIRQLTLQAGSTTLEQINFYDYYHAGVLLPHSTNRSYVMGDSAIQEGSTLANGKTDYAARTYCIPLALGCFNSSRAFPLYLLNGSPLTLTIDWETQTQALVPTGGTITSVTYSEVQLVYELVELDDSFKQAVKMRMADPQAPALFQMEIDTVLASRIANGASVNLNIGTNMSSAKSVIVTTCADTASTQKAFVQDGLSDLYVYYDGKVMNSVRLNKTAVQYIEANKCLGVAFAPELTFVGSTEQTINGEPPAFDNYEDLFYLTGVASTRFNAQGNAMTGIPVSMININATKTGVAGNFYYFIVYSQIIAIDAMGNVNLIR